MARNGTSAMIALMQRGAENGAELSVTTSNESVGVLTCAGSEDAAELLHHWQPAGGAYAVPPHMRLARCDFTRTGCEVLTLYFDDEGGNGSGLGALAVFPRYAEAVRLRPGGEAEHTTYFDARGVPGEDALAAATLTAARIGFPRAVISTMRDLTKPMLALGWLQTVAVTREPATVKFGVSTSSLGRAVALIADHDRDGARRLHRALRQLGGILGYAGVKVRGSGDVSWRLYARTFPCSALSDTIARLV